MGKARSRAICRLPRILKSSQFVYFVSSCSLQPVRLFLPAQQAYEAFGYYEGPETASGVCPGDDACPDEQDIASDGDAQGQVKYMALPFLDTSSLAEASPETPAVSVEDIQASVGLL